MIRQMQSTVGRIRSNVARMQTQLSTIESVATQMPLLRPIVSHSNGSSVPDQAMANVNANRELVEQIEQRVGAVSRSINDIVTRLSSSLSVGAPGSQMMALNPINTLNSIIQNHHNLNQRVRQPSLLQL